MACEGATWIIDPEFAFYGPMYVTLLTTHYWIKILIDYSLLYFLIFRFVAFLLSFLFCLILFLFFFYSFFLAYISVFSTRLFFLFSSLFFFSHIWLFINFPLSFPLSTITIIYSPLTNLPPSYCISGDSIQARWFQICCCLTSLSMPQTVYNMLIGFLNK